MKIGRQLASIESDKKEFFFANKQTHRHPNRPSKGICQQSIKLLSSSFVTEHQLTITTHTHTSTQQTDLFETM